MGNRITAVQERVGKHQHEKIPVLSLTFIKWHFPNLLGGYSTFFFIFLFLRHLFPFTTMVNNS